MLYLQLFWSFFQIGLLGFGGGLAVMPLIQYQIVEKHGWLTLQQFTDLITISEMTPGPIAINSATFVGSQIAGPIGAIISTLGCITPSCVIVLSLAWLYGKYREVPVIQGVLAGLRPTVVALILSAGLTILTLSLFGHEGFSWNLATIDYLAAGLFIAGLIVLRKFRTSPILVMLSCGFLGGIGYLLLDI